MFGSFTNKNSLKTPSVRKYIITACHIILKNDIKEEKPIQFSAFAEDVVTAQPLSESGEVTQEQIEKNIVGKWILADKDGQPALTNEKPILTIVSPTEAYSSLSNVTETGSPWHSSLQCGHCFVV